MRAESIRLAGLSAAIALTLTPHPARTVTGAGCGSCTDPEWTYESKGIE